MCVGALVEKLQSQAVAAVLLRCWMSALALTSSVQAGQDIASKGRIVPFEIDASPGQFTRLLECRPPRKESQ